MRKRDSYGNYFEFPEAELSWKELEKIRAEINTQYSKYRGEPAGLHRSYGLDNKAYTYYFENHGFDDINIYYREEIE